MLRGPVLDDGSPSLLVGNRGLADYNRMHGTNDGYMGPGCPRSIPIVGNALHADALASVVADPNCFTLYERFPGGVHPAVRRRLRRLLVRQTEHVAPTPR